MPDDPLDELYSVAPDGFLAQRARLVEQARKSGDEATAREIGKLRKPTVAAWVVNAHVLAEPGSVAELGELGEHLRAAQHALDADAMREFSYLRRQLVNRLTTAALKRAGRAQPPAGLRDEVSATFEAALADPEIAGRLGRLQRAEQWSGFGFAAGAPPQLTVVRGGRDDKPAPKAAPKQSAAERRKQQRALEDAQHEFDDAEAALDEAQRAEHDLAARVRTLTAKLANVQGQLDEARGDLEDARRELTEARTRRRQARVALDRAERDAT